MIQNQSKTESGNWFPWNRYGSNIRKNKREPGHGEAGAYGAGKSGITGMVGTGSASNPGLSHEGHEKHSGSNVGAHQGTKGWSQSHAPSKLRGTWDKMTGSVEEGVGRMFGSTSMAMQGQDKKITGQSEVEAAKAASLGVKGTGSGIGSGHGHGSAQTAGYLAPSVDPKNTRPGTEGRDGTYKGYFPTKMKGYQADHVDNPNRYEPAHF